MNKAVVAGVVVVAVLLVGFFVTRQEPVQIASSGAGDTQTSRQFFQSGLVEGGVYSVSTTSATLTLNSRSLAGAKIITIENTNSPAQTFTLPASTTFPLAKGESQMWIVDNIHSAAATTSTFTAGTGVDLDGTTANDDVINGGVSGTLRCWRLADTNVRCIVEEMVDAG